MCTSDYPGSATATFRSLLLANERRKIASAVWYVGYMYTSAVRSLGSSVAQMSLLVIDPKVRPTK